MPNPEVQLRPIVGDDADAVGAFLTAQLNPRIPASAWRSLVEPPWAHRGPDRGFLLEHDGRIVGVYAAVHSWRERSGERIPVTNLAAFCVEPEFRAHSLRLLRSLLRDRAAVITDLSPSGNVIGLNERLGFTRLAPTARLTVNLPARRGDVELVEDPDAIAAALTGREAEVFADHRHAPAARHLLVRRGDAHAYLMYRRDRRKRMRIVATPLHASGDRALLRAAWPAIAARLLRHGLPLTIAERRVLGFLPAGGRDLPAPRTRMHRGSAIPAEAIDYLYSELVLLEW